MRGKILTLILLLGIQFVGNDCGKNDQPASVPLDPANQPTPRSATKLTPISDEREIKIGEGGGGGAVPRCSVSSSELVFDDVEVGAYSDGTFTLTNISASAITGNVSESCSDYSIVSGGGPFTLAPAAMRSVTVRFAPSVSGPKRCVVEGGAELYCDVACIGNGIPPCTGTGFTVECWVKARSLPGYDPRIVRCTAAPEGPCGDPVANVWDLAICRNSCATGTVGFTIESAGACYEVHSSASINDGNYHHVAGVYDMCGTLRVYVDGNVWSTPVPSSLNVCVGGGMLAVGNATALPPNDNPFDGAVDELRIWNVARSQAEIVSGMGGEISPTASLVGYWRFNGDTSDLSANVNSLTASGTVTFVSGRPGFGQAVDIQNPPYSLLSAAAVAAYSIGICGP